MKKILSSELQTAIPDWAQWLAQDEDGTWWAYEAEPNQQHNGWYENEVGRIQRLGKTAPPADWQTTLRGLKP
jgi:hypothetical protein